MHVLYYKYFISVSSAMHLLHIHSKSFLQLWLACFPMLPLLSSSTQPLLTAFNYTVLCKLNTCVLACIHSDRAKKIEAE